MKICIIGGGTAGWIAAYMLQRVDKVSSVAVIESDKIDIIGTGEGSTGIFSGIIDTVSSQDFMTSTNSTYKLGIKHQGWYKKDHFYNGPIDSPLNSSDQVKDLYSQTIIDNANIGDSHINAQLMDKNFQPFADINGMQFKVAGSIAYHFDGREVGNFFKKHLMNNAKVSIHMDTIVKTFFENDKLVSIQGEKQIYSADFFIDCTGFRRLLNDNLNIPWISYSKYLSVDTAIPFLLAKKDINYTVAQAMNAGWMWQIPKTNNTGCGYNFNSNFISQDQAIIEIENFLGHSIEPIKIIKYKVGRLKKIVESNIMFLGLSANFLEPLEATSIHTTIVQLYKYIDFINGICSIEKFNSDMAIFMEDMRDFIGLHYRTQREDTDFWTYEKYRSKNEISHNLEEQLTLFSEGIIESCFDNISIPLIFPVAYGLNLIAKKKIKTNRRVPYMAKEIVTNLEGFLK